MWMDQLWIGDRDILYIEQSPERRDHFPTAIKIETAELVPGCGIASGNDLNWGIETEQFPMDDLHLAGCTRTTRRITAVNQLGQVNRHLSWLRLRRRYGM